MDAFSSASSSTGFSLCAFAQIQPKPKPHRLKPMLLNRNRILSVKGTVRSRGGKARKIQGAILLDSAPSDSSDDSGQVLALPPNRLGGTADGDFGGISCCTFRTGLRSSSEHPPGYSLLPHLYQDAANIAPRHTRGQIKLHEGRTKQALISDARYTLQRFALGCRLHPSRVLGNHRQTM